MNSAVHYRNEGEGQQSDREINLSATLILGLFFSLAIVCAIFFGLGYSVGRKSLLPVLGGAGTVPVQTPPSFGGFKPAAGSASGQPTAPPHTGPSVVLPLEAGPLGEKSSSTVPIPADRYDPPVVEAAADAFAGKPLETASVMVQVAAVSHQEDADLLVTTLRRRGYAVAIHSEPQDKLMHVQVGPFPSHKEADVMRQKLLADGFNAILKDQR